MGENSKKRGGGEQTNGTVFHACMPAVGRRDEYYGNLCLYRRGGGGGAVLKLNSTILDGERSKGDSAFFFVTQNFFFKK